MNYLDKLRESAKETGSIACMGLDPVVDAMPAYVKGMDARGIPNFIEKIFEEMTKQKVFPGAFKPNQGFYVMHDRSRAGDFSGSQALSAVMNMIEDMFPGIPVILDYKRGDIATSSANYAAEGFESWRADAVTVAPYMGTDSVSPFAKYCNKEQGKGIYVLDRTSNPGARGLQNLEVALDTNTLVKEMIGESDIGKTTMPLYEAVAHKIMEWSADNPGVGAVIGATSPGELGNILAVINGYEQPQIPLLIPGVGSQGGTAPEVMAKLRESSYELPLVRINSSSGITHPWVKKKEPAPADFAKVCVEKLAELNEQTGYRKSA
jgi:orotidine-5'-phosphate decarboxylase